MLDKQHARVRTAIATRRDKQAEVRAALEQARRHHLMLMVTAIEVGMTLQEIVDDEIAYMQASRQIIDLAAEPAVVV